MASSCHTVAPSYNYKKLAKAAIKLNMDIDMTDNHKLYFEVADWIGVPYRYGGTNKRGVDCSGFSSSIYKKVYKTKIGRTTDDQQKTSRKVNKQELKEGDLVFFSNKRLSKKPTHVGIYLKDNKFVHASSSKGVMINNLKEDYYRRYWLEGGRIR